MGGGSNGDESTWSPAVEAGNDARARQLPGATGGLATAAAIDGDDGADAGDAPDADTGAPRPSPDDVDLPDAGETTTVGDTEVEVEETPDDGGDDFYWYSAPDDTRYPISEKALRERLAGPTATDDATEAERRLVEEFGAVDADLDGLSEATQERVADALVGVDHERLDDALAIDRVTTTDRDPSSSRVGYYHAPDRELYLNPDVVDGGVNQHPVANQLADGTVEGVVHHEAGHAHHFAADPDEYGTLSGQSLSTQQGRAALQEVSHYATTSPKELVAETFAGRLDGQSYGNYLDQLYDSFNGPEVP